MSYPAENLKNLTVEITDACNLACRLCYTESSPGKRRMMPAETVLQLLMRARATVESVALTGGESFLHPDLEQICRNARPYFKEFSILTNATDIKDDQLDWVAELDVKLGISIDGRESVHDQQRGRGNFQRSANAMVRARKKGIQFWIQTIIGDFNAHDLEYLVQLADALGAYSVAFQRPKKMGRANERNAIWMEPNRYREVVRNVHKLKGRYPRIQVHIKDALYNCEDVELRERAESLQPDSVIGGCRAGLTYLYVKASGDVLMCPFIPTVIGNIGSQDLYAIWDESQPLKMLRSREAYQQCGNCNNFSLCRGCRAEALAWTGELMGSDPNCWTKPVATSD